MYHLFILDDSKLDHVNREADNYYDNAYLNVATMQANGWIKEKSTCSSKDELIDWLCFKLDDFEGCTAAIYENKKLVMGGTFEQTWVEDLEDED